MEMTHEASRRAYIRSAVTCLLVLAAVAVLMWWLQQGNLLGGQWRVPLLALVSLLIIYPLVRLGRLTFRRLQQLGYDAGKWCTEWVLLLACVTALHHVDSGLSAAICYAGNVLAVAMPLGALLLCAAGWQSKRA